MEDTISARAKAFFEKFKAHVSVATVTAFAGGFILGALIF